MPPFKPFKSQAQERLFNSSARPSGISSADVAGMDKASKGMKLPVHSKKSKKGPKRSKTMINMRHLQ